MLALARKKGQSIIIADNIEITVLSVKGEQVKIGVHAPREIPVHRKEIYDQIVEENRLAVESASVENLKKILNKED